LLVARDDSTGKAVPLLVLRADPDEREALLSIGHPFFASRAGRDRIVVVLTDGRVPITRPALPRIRAIVSSPGLPARERRQGILRSHPQALQQRPGQNLIGPDSRGRPRQPASLRDVAELDFREAADG
jgi:hypothetical protein